MQYIPARQNTEGTALTEYPLDLRAAYPDWGFPPDIEQHNLTPEMIADGVVLVLMVGQPMGDFASVTPGDPALFEAEWRTTWVTTDFDLAGLKDKLKARLGQDRYAFETGGVDLANGLRVNTTTEDQNRITSVLVNAERAGFETIKFKSTAGFVEMTLDELRAIAGAIAVHVQTAFNTEEAVYTEIDALGTVAEAQEFAAGYSFPVAAQRLLNANAA